MRNTLLHRWKRLAHRAAEIQSIAVLTLLYWTVVAPIGLLRQRGRREPRPPEWKLRQPAGVTSVADARRQF